MKFSDIDRAEWEELRPYLDTCLLPVTGISGAEQPADATEALERLRDVMALVEDPFKGRVVTYPALHYTDGSSAAQVEKVCAALKAEAGFRFVIVATASETVAVNAPSADLHIAPGECGALPEEALVSAAVQSMWAMQQGSDAVRGE